jgi:hypothetical protein
MQIMPICVIGAGCDEVGEAVQNGGEARALIVTRRNMTADGANLRLILARPGRWA